jgi:hypothetical protein
MKLSRYCSKTRPLAALFSRNSAKSWFQQFYALSNILRRFLLRLNSLRTSAWSPTKYCKVYLCILFSGICFRSASESYCLEFFLKKWGFFVSCIAKHNSRSRKGLSLSMKLRYFSVNLGEGCVKKCICMYKIPSSATIKWRDWTVLGIHYLLYIIIFNRKTFRHIWKISLCQIILEALREILFVVYMVAHRKLEHKVDLWMKIAK